MYIYHKYLEQSNCSKSAIHKCVTDEIDIQTMVLLTVYYFNSYLKNYSQEFNAIFFNTESLCSGID